LRFFDSDGDEVTRADHRPPPLLDENAQDIRDWLAGGSTA
jgi:hypothetical protein